MCIAKAGGELWMSRLSSRQLFLLCGGTSSRPFDGAPDGAPPPRDRSGYQLTTCSISPSRIDMLPVYPACQCEWVLSPVLPAGIMLETHPGGDAAAAYLGVVIRQPYPPATSLQQLTHCNPGPHATPSPRGGAGWANPKPFFYSQPLIAT